MKAVTENDRIWYRRTFEVPPTWRGQRLLLHFGAVDFEATVWVNGKEVGRHAGGYDAFSFDITDALAASGPNELVVAVWDPTDAGTQSAASRSGSRMEFGTPRPAASGRRSGWNR
jgi:beta-galactosidase/beta-glucuronidase